MYSSTVMSLVNNASLLLALGLLYDMLGNRLRSPENSLRHQIFAGTVSGVIGIAVMTNPLDFGQGIFFDTRSVLLCISGFFLGTVPAILAVLLTAFFRLFLGGEGAGTGVAVIVTSGGIGLAWRYLRRDKKSIPSLGELYLLGIVVHVTMLACLLSLPWDTARAVLSTISLPVLAIYPLTTALLGLLMVNREKRNFSETALRKSEEKFRKLFHDHSAVKLLIDPITGNIVEANKAAEKFYGWPTAKLKTMRIQEINTLSPKEIRVEMEKARSLHRTHFEFQHRLADGSIRDVEVFSSNIEGEGKEILHSIVHDITEKKSAEELLRESVEYKRAMIAASPLAIISLTPEGLVRSWNPAAERIFGWREEDLLGKPLPLVPEELQGEFSALRRRVLAGETFSRLELLRRRKDGSPIDISLSTAAIHDRNGRINGIMAVIEDITERKKTQEEKNKLNARLIQAQKMEAIGTLAGGIAHDFNNILGAILGYSELVLQKLPEGSEEHEDLKEVLAATLRAKELTRQILTFSRQRQRDPEPLHLAPIIKEAVKMLRCTIPSTITFTIDIAEEDGLVLADPTQIHQVIMNLCTNAYHAMRETGGALSVRLTGIEVAQEFQAAQDVPNGHYYLLEVADTGCGIPAEALSKIFEPYYTSKAPGVGTGLGLAVVQGIIEECGGRILVESQVGEGTVMRVFFPRIPAENCIQFFEESSPLPPPYAKGERILLVDDEQPLADALARSLKAIGCRVATFYDSEAALAAIRQAPRDYDVVISDVTMPRLNGLQLAQNILALRKGMPIILCTGYSELVDEEKIKELGIAALLHKPLSTQRLLMALRQLPEGHGQNL